LAENGADASKIVEQQTVNILIRDIGMPDFDGYQPFKKIALTECYQRQLAPMAGPFMFKSVIGPSDFTS
jgi:CheY-like chemotaxis protein